MQTYRQKDSQTDTQIDRQTDRQRDRQTDRQIADRKVPSQGHLIIKVENV